MKIHQRMRVLLVLTAVAGASCAAPEGGAPADVALAAEAVTVVDCQTEAAECLGMMPSRQQVGQCQAEWRMCVGDAAGSGGLGTGSGARAAISDCGTQAAECTRNADSLADATMCRAEYEACVGDLIDLPERRVPRVNPPGLPRAGAGDLADGVNSCRDSALTCAREAGRDLQAVAACADEFTSCARELLGMGTDDDSDDDGSDDDGSDDDGSDDCIAEARACVEGAAGEGDLRDCASQYLECAGPGARNPRRRLPELPELPDLPDLPDLPELPDLPGRRGGGPDLPSRSAAADCLESLSDCLENGGSSAGCVEDARACAGL